ncbi:MAG: transcriptional repressor [Actinomycetota bacterium]|nr:transcriptional repressor [Acidimicrobiia bacterium]MDQ3468467.1 transcriptional repressor [Actinomycetota bacterium]
MTAPTATRTSGPAGVAEAILLLHRRGWRVTKARSALLDDLHAAPGRVTADELIQRHPDADPATIYRSLAQFEAAGILEHVHLGHGPAAYRWVGARTFTVVCDGCGRTSEIPRRDVASFVAAIERRHGFAVDLGHFALSGHCADCTATGGAS